MGPSRVTFLHTADWQLGKPFAGVDDERKRALLVQERFAAVQRLGQLARECEAAFIVVAGDLFDSPHVSKSTVSAACAAIGSLGCPVLVIPGNHDHGGPGCIWDQEFFRREAAALSPNLVPLLRPAAHEIGQAVVLPCPLLRRAESVDTTAWLRDPAVAGGFPDRVRIVLAHGSVQGFGEGEAGSDEDPANQTGPNRIDLAPLPMDAVDYVALGDWHGWKRVGEKAWYAGTPEIDRFPKGEQNLPGFVLKVVAARGVPPEVTALKSGRLGWHRIEHDFASRPGVTELERTITRLLGGRADQDLLHLALRGSVGLEEATHLERFLESLRARLLRLKLEDATRVLPTPEEITGLRERHADPLIARVAHRLLDEAAGQHPESALAQVALRELYLAVRAEEGKPCA